MGWGGVGCGGRAGVNCGGHLDMHADIYTVIFVMLGSLAECRCQLCCRLLAALTCCVIGSPGYINK